MTVKLATGLVAVAAVALSGASFADGSVCDSVLTAHLADESTVIDKSSARETSKYAACSMTFHEFNDTYGGSAAGQYGVISGSGSYNQQNYQQWQTNNCSAASAESNHSAFLYSAQKTFKSDIVTAWSQCMERQEGMSCWASPSTSNRNVVVNVRWKSDEPDLPLIVSQSVQGSTTKSIVALGSPILKNTTKFSLDRQSDTSDVIVVLNAKRGNIGYPCEVSAPYLRPAPSLALPAPQASFSVPSGQPKPYNFIFTAARGQDNNVYITLFEPCGGKMEFANYPDSIITKDKSVVQIPLVAACTVRAWGTLDLRDGYQGNRSVLFFTGGFNVNGVQTTVIGQAILSLSASK